LANGTSNNFPNLKTNISTNKHSYELSFDFSDEKSNELSFDFSDEKSNELSFDFTDDKSHE
jgi:hypothetical protein